MTDPKPTTDGLTASQAVSPAATTTTGGSPSPPATPQPTDQDPDLDVANVNFKLAPYWPNDPQIWFIQAEAHFATHRITNQKRRYHIVVSSLAPEFATEIRDLLLNPPADNQYDRLKEALIGRTQKSEQARLRELLSTEELGDRPPSKLLRRMQQLLGDKSLDGSLLKELFLQRLPTAVRMILSSAPDSLTIDQLARMADKVVESTPSTTVHAISTPTTESSEIASLREEVTSLVATVKSLVGSAQPYRGRTRLSSRLRSASRSPTRDTSEGEMCWYHTRYGSNARHCRPPCSFKSSSENSNASG